MQAIGNGFRHQLPSHELFQTRFVENPSKNVKLNFSNKRVLGQCKNKHCADELGYFFAVYLRCRSPKQQGVS